MIQIIKQAEINGHIVDARVSPIRDIAHIWGSVAVECLGNLDNVMKWPSDLREWMVNKGTKVEDVVAAAQAFVDAMQLALESGMANPSDALEKTGFFKCRPEAKAAVVYRLGMYTAGIWWEGIRDASIVTGKPKVFQDMVNASKVLNTYIERPWWKKVGPFLTNLPAVLKAKLTRTRKQENDGSGS